MRIFTIILIALLWTLPAFAEETQQELKVSEWTPEQKYAVGQQMAECAASFRFMADLPNVKGKPATAELAGNKARGWEMAAALLIADGLTPDQSTHTLEIVDNLVKNKKTYYASLIEMKGADGFKELTTEFDKNCMPLVPLQTAIEDGMRKGAPNAKQHEKLNK